MTKQEWREHFMKDLQNFGRCSVESTDGNNKRAITVISELAKEFSETHELTVTSSIVVYNKAIAFGNLDRSGRAISTIMRLTKKVK